MVSEGSATDQLSLNDIEYEIREKIARAANMDNEDELQNYIYEESTFAIAGWPIISKIGDKDLMITDVIRFYACDRIRPALTQLEHGLKSGNLLALIRANPTSFEQIMCGDKSGVTAEQLNTLFTVKYAENGTSQRHTQNRTITFWRDFLLDCEDDEERPTLIDVLIFATGADAIPPLGFDITPSITFQNDSKYPTANTCGLELRLPTVHQKYTEFKDNVKFGILNCPDFCLA